MSDLFHVGIDEGSCADHLVGVDKIPDLGHDGDLLHVEIDCAFNSHTQVVTTIYDEGPCRVMVDHPVLYQ